MSRFRAVRLVAGRELYQAVRRRSLWVVVGLLFVGSTAAVVGPEVVGGSGTTRYDVVVVGHSPTLTQGLRALGPSIDATIHVITVEDAATARRRVQDQSADLALVVGDPPRIIVQAGQHAPLVGAARQALASDALARRLQREGLSEAEVQDVFAAPSPTLQEVDKSSESRRLASFALGILLYILLLSLMVQVATATAVEKSNRISEVLLAIVRPGSLLFGKVIGVCIVGLLTLLAAILPAGVKLAVGGDLPEGIGGALAASAAWFGLGLVLYLTIAASLGALVERQEEVGSVMMPLMATLIGTFIVAQSAADSPLGTVLAYVPLTAPLMVPTRIALGVSSPIEVVLSLVILVAAIVVAGRAGSTIYARAIVRTGRRLKLQDLRRASG